MARRAVTRRPTSPRAREAWRSTSRPAGRVSASEPPAQGPRSVPSARPVADRVLEVQADRLIDLIDRLLDKGVSVTGDVTLGVAGVDLIYLRLSSLLCAVDRLMPSLPPGERPPRPGRSRR